MVYNAKALGDAIRDLPARSEANQEIDTGEAVTLLSEAHSTVRHLERTGAALLDEVRALRRIAARHGLVQNARDSAKMLDHCGALGLKGVPVIGPRL